MKSLLSAYRRNEIQWVYDSIGQPDRALELAREIVDKPDDESHYKSAFGHSRGHKSKEAAAGRMQTGTIEKQRSCMTTVFNII